MQLVTSINYWEIAANTCQINFIKFVESNKCDNVYSKIWNIFVWSNFLKIGCVLINQISLMKKIQSVKVLNCHIRGKQ